MIYKLDNINIASFGAIPVLGGERLALEGLFSLPKRKGATEYNWGTSIEPFVAAEDIELEGRELILNLAIQKASNQVTALKQALTACQVLAVDFDVYNVVCKHAIKLVEKGEYLFIEARYWQNDYELKPITILPSFTGSYRLGAFDLLKDFGIIVSELNDTKNVAGRIEVSTTELYTQTQYREQRELSLDAFAKGDSISELYSKLTQFSALLCAPGFISLTSPAGRFVVWQRSGFKAQYVAEHVVKFSLKLVVND